MMKKKVHAAYITVGVQFEAFSDSEINAVLENYNLIRNTREESPTEWTVRKIKESEGTFRYELWEISDDTYVLGKNVYGSIGKKFTEKVDISEIQSTLDDVCQDMPDAKILLFSCEWFN